MIDAEWWDYDSAEELAEAVAGDAQFVIESALDARGDAVVAFAEKVGVDPNYVLDDDFEALMDEGFTREEICEIIAVIDMATMFNVYTSTLRLDLDPQYEAIL